MMYFVILHHKGSVVYGEQFVVSVYLLCEKIVKMQFNITTEKFYRKRYIVKIIISVV